MTDTQTETTCMITNEIPWIHGSDPSNSDEDKVSGDANQPASVVQRVDDLKE